MNAWETYQRTKKCFQPPTDWRAEDWRNDLVLASGLTAVAAEAVLLDIVPAGAHVVRDPSALRGQLGDNRLGVVGCSYSCDSAEVLDGLAIVREAGLRTCLVGGGLRGPADLKIGSSEIDHAFQHIPFCAVLPQLFGQSPQVERRELPFDLLLFYRMLYERNLTPLFVGGQNGFSMRALHSYWLEYVNRAAFHVVFPEWTHDLLWAMVRANCTSYGFILESPVRDLSDGRFDRVVDLLEQLQIPYHVLNFGVGQARSSFVEQLLATADGYYQFACELGLDLSTPLRFET